MEPGSIFEPKGYKGTSIIMYVFNSISGAILHFILYVQNFQKFTHLRKQHSKTYKIIPFSNVRFRIMYVFQKNVQNASFLCGCHVSYSNFILYVFFNFRNKRFSFGKSHLKISFIMYVIFNFLYEKKVNVFFNHSTRYFPMDS